MDEVNQMPATARVRYLLALGLWAAAVAWDAVGLSVRGVFGLLVAAAGTMTILAGIVDREEHMREMVRLAILVGAAQREHRGH